MTIEAKGGPQEVVVIQAKVRWFAGVPWWLLSLGLHSLGLLAAALVLIDRLIPIEGEPCITLSQARTAPVVTEIERPRDIYERRGIPKDDVLLKPSEGPAIYFPESRESDHSESADGESYHMMKGDSRGVYDTMGVGTGGGGGGRSGGAPAFAGAADTSGPARRAAAAATKDGGPRVPAGESDDNAQFDDYLRYFKAYTGQDVRKLDISDRMVITFVNSEKKPVSNTPVEILGEGGRVHRGVTTAAGSLMFAPRVAGVGENECRFTAEIGGQKIPFRRGGEIELAVDVAVPERRGIDVDVAFCLDTTGSMGDEIDAIKRTLRDVADRLDRLRPRPRLRYGMVQYRDHGDAYVTRVTDFTENLDTFLGTLNRVQADGGGDYEEAMSEALCRSVNDLSWRTGDAIRVLFLIGDAPPHTNYADGFDYARGMQQALEKGIKLFTIAASGLNDKGEFIWRQLAQFTLAKFMFITYGGATSHHVGEFKENNLDDLMVRAVSAEVQSLKGRPFPPAPPRN